MHDLRCAVLTIRKEQMRAFEDAQLARFQKEVLAHIEHFDPEPAQTREREELEGIVNDAVSMAARLNFGKREDALRYVLFVYLLGPGFESDPSYPWVRETFNDPECTLTQKLDILCVFGEHLLGSRFQKLMPRHE